MLPLSKQNEILELWRDPNFSGSYSGLANFQSCLQNEKNIYLSRNELLQILKKDRNYVLEMRKVPKVIERRGMNIHGYGNLFQADVGILFEHDNYIGFLLCIDVYSRRIFCEKLKSRTKEEVQKAFKNIFLEAAVKPEKIETDAGGEFVGNKLFFEKEKIFFKIKTGANKAR